MDEWWSVDFVVFIDFMEDMGAGRCHFILLFSKIWVLVSLHLTFYEQNIILEQHFTERNILKGRRYPVAVVARSRSSDS